MKLSSFLHFAGFGIKTVLFRKKEPRAKCRDSRIPRVILSLLGGFLTTTILE